MTSSPILNAGLEVQIHVVAALIALAIGPISIWRKRRDRIHKTLGVTWIAAMLVLATSGLFIHEIRMIGPFSPIHLFSFLTYFSLWRAISHLRARRFGAHGKAMKGLYFGALIVAGFFTLLPGRTFNRMLFGDYANEGFAAMLTAAVIVVVWRQWQQRRPAAS